MVLPESKIAAILMLSVITNPLSMAQTANQLQKLSKKELIKKAAEKIQDSSFAVADFDRIEVWRDEEQLTVEFSHVINFIPKKGQYYYSATVDLVTGSPAKYIQGDGSMDENVNFYKPSKFQKEIQFVIDAINRSQGEVGKIPKGKLPDGYMTLRENETYYDITVDSESTHSYYKIKKVTGEVYDAGHKHYMQGGGSNRKRIY